MVQQKLKKQTNLEMWLHAHCVTAGDFLDIITNNQVVVLKCIVFSK